ncbi:hypothetical protein D3C73_1304470 [compost metagenome]
MQAQLRQIRLQPPQPRDEPARQQAARAAQHEWRLADIPAEFGADTAQPVERFTTGITQPDAGICEFDATPVLDEQGHAQVFLQHLDLPAHGAMSYMQRLGSLADAIEPGGGFEGPQGVQGRKVVGHLTCEFS